MTEFECSTIQTFTNSTLRRNMMVKWEKTFVTILFMTSVNIHIGDVMLKCC